MQTDERFKQILNATAEQLARIDAALAGHEGREIKQSFRLYKMGDAARETGISRCTLWRAIREGRIKTIEIRKDSHRIPESELRRFVEVKNV